MITKTTLKSLIAAAALNFAITATAEAETGFSTLAGIEAEPMNAAEMDATQGRFFDPGLFLGLQHPFANDPNFGFGPGVFAAFDAPLWPSFAWSDLTAPFGGPQGGLIGSGPFGGPIPDWTPFIASNLGLGPVPVFGF